jgi:hypothetical protein
MLPPDATPSVVFGVENFLAMAYGAIGGALVTVVALRTRLAMMGRDISDNKRQIDRLEREIEQRLKMMDRRSVFALQIMADVARKVGADGRFSDQVIRMLSDEAARENKERDTMGGGL